MSEVAGGSAPVPAGQEMGTFERLVGVFFSPAKTFGSIARKPGVDWLVPVLLMVALVVVSAFTINPKLDVDSAVQQTIKKIEQRQQLDDAGRERVESAVRKQMSFMTTGPGRFIAPVVVLIPFFLVPLFYHGIAAAFGASTRYMTVVAGYAWVQLVQVVKFVIAIAVSIPRKTIDINDGQNLVRSNVGAFLNADTTSKPLMAVASSIDLFEIWGLVLTCIMLSRTTKLSKNAATITVVALWLVWVLVKVGGAALGAAFGG
jgi:hypothetical protein